MGHPSFVPWDVLSLGKFCPLDHNYVLGSFVFGRFGCAPCTVAVQCALCSHQSRQWGYELMKTTENHEEKEISKLVKTIQ